MEKKWTRKNSNVYLFFGPGGYVCLYFFCLLLLFVFARKQRDYFDRNVKTKEMKSFPLENVAHGCAVCEKSLMANQTSIELQNLVSQMR